MVRFDKIEEAFSFVNSAPYGEHKAWLCLENSKILWLKMKSWKSILNYGDIYKRASNKEFLRDIFVAEGLHGILVKKELLLRFSLTTWGGIIRIKRHLDLY